jgi:hypothetical protein
MSRTNAGMNAIYNGGLTSGIGVYGSGRHHPMHGGGWLDSVKAANNWAKNHKIVTKASGVVDDLGLTGKFDQATGGYYTKLVGVAKKHGYGKKRKTGGRKRKTKK